MTIEIRVPELPESIVDAVVASWLKQQGEYVDEEMPLLELETDKVVLEVPAPIAGTLEKIMIQQGDTVVAGDVLALFVPNEKKKDVTIQSASPSVRKMMYEQDVSVKQVSATGGKGKILKRDVQVALEQRHQQADASIVKPHVVNTPHNRVTDIPTISTNANHEQRKERRVPMSRLRQRVAERLLQAQHNAAILTTFNEVDLSDITRLRKTYQERFQHAHGAKLGFMSFFVKAATEALKRFPEINARIEGNDIIYQGFYDIGVAVSTERGLVVPLLRNTDQMGHAAIEKSITDYANRARDGRLTMEELTGGTFSISNGGVFGSLLSTPILNPPQSAILGMHKIEPRAVVREGEIVIRPMMYLALSYDHRLIDGKTAVGFLMLIKGLLEDPASLLLEL
jgi:2-oxoglutarate dehydrogenase E2 component (dihydrolipoamide succinyltransferase)